ncbi:MAG: histidine phosphatase family protein [Acetobacter sp.]|nr:histidine phosphatase family protein [Acetobacter sp.]
MNVQGVWAGSGSDVVLTDIGLQQAEELARKFRSMNFTLYSSPLLRAVQTAKAIARGRLDFVVMQDLRECDFGDEEGVSLEETKKRYGSEIIDSLLWPTDETADLRFPNGESKREVFERVDGCLGRIVAKHSFSWSKSTVCVVCHAGVLSALQFGYKLTDVSFDNCAVLHLQYDTELHRFVQVFD